MASDVALCIHQLGPDFSRVTASVRGLLRRQHHARSYLQAARGLGAVVAGRGARHNHRHAAQEGAARTQEAVVAAAGLTSAVAMVRSLLCTCVLALSSGTIVQQHHVMTPIFINT